MLWLGWPLVESEPEKIAATVDDSGEGEGEGDGDWLEREVEMVWASDATNVLKLIWVLVGVVVAPSTALAVELDVGVTAVATETAVLACANVVEVDTALDTAFDDASTVSWMVAVDMPSCTVCV